MTEQSPETRNGVRINERPCATCPFVSADRRAFDFVEPAEAEKLKADCKTSGRLSPNVCHASVYGMHGIKGGPSVCGGFVAANPNHPFNLHNRFALPRPKTISVPVPKAAKPID